MGAGWSVVVVVGQMGWWDDSEERENVLMIGIKLDFHRENLLPHSEALSEYLTLDAPLVFGYEEMQNKFMTPLILDRNDQNFPLNETIFY